MPCCKNRSNYYAHTLFFSFLCPEIIPSKNLSYHQKVYRANGPLAYFLTVIHVCCSEAAEGFFRPLSIRASPLAISPPLERDSDAFSGLENHQPGDKRDLSLFFARLEKIARLKPIRQSLYSLFFCNLSFSFPLAKVCMSGFLVSTFYYLCSRRSVFLFEGRRH